MPSRWVKVCPWYYTERNQPSRARAKRDAIRRDRDAVGPLHP